MSRILITGASGFIGGALMSRLHALGHDVIGAGRSARGVAQCGVGALDANTDWRAALAGVDAVAHLAAPAHTQIDAATAQRAITDATAALAAQSRAAGVARFLYLSSIRACVDRTAPGAAASPLTRPSPQTAYGRAKLAAEAHVLAHDALRPVVLRPPLVHDAGAKGNWARLMALLDSDLPLPLAGLKRPRSVIALASLVDAITAVLQAPADAPAGIYHVADTPELGVATMARLLREGMGRPARLFDAGPFSALAPRQLREALEIDASAFARDYGWSGVDSEAALRADGAAWAAR